MQSPDQQSSPRSTPVYLSLGSNLGDRAGMLAAAREALRACGRIEIIRETSVLENPAILHTDQGDFLNQIVVVRTELDPFELLERLKTIEKNLGRKERFRYGPREIDLDILVYGKRQIESETLTLPHPGLKDRDFLRVLLADLDETPESIA